MSSAIEFFDFMHVKGPKQTVLDGKICLNEWTALNNAKGYYTEGSTIQFQCCWTCMVYMSDESSSKARSKIQHEKSAESNNPMNEPQRAT